MQPPFYVNNRNKLVDKDKIPSGPIGYYLGTSAGRKALAASMAAPIRRSLDYHGIARRALVIDQLPPGALPSFEREVRKFKNDYLEVDQRGKLIDKNDKFTLPRFRRVTFPKFEIHSNPVVHLTDIKARRFNLIDRYNGRPKVKQPVVKFKHGTLEVTHDIKLIDKQDRKRRRFNVIDRAVQKARQEIMAQEDAEIFKALDAASCVDIKYERG